MPSSVTKKAKIKKRPKPSRRKSAKIEVPNFSPQHLELVRREVKQELAYRRLHEFVKQGWDVVERKGTFKDGWHIGCICENLEAVSLRQINRLAINIPPRHMKSLNTCVFWQAKHWLREPWFQWLLSSYHEKLSVRDNVKCRRLIESNWYKSLVELAMRREPEVWDQGMLRMVGDQNTKIRYENNYLGYRIATSVGGANTGEGGDGLVIDDANNVMKAESDVAREEVIIWFDETMQTRLNDPDGPIVVMQQRTHEADLSGHIQEKYRDEYTYLILPARYEPKVFVTNVQGEQEEAWPPPYDKDPRTEVGQPLWPEQYPEDKLASLEKRMTDYAVAGQLQQRPAPRKGGMYKPDQMRIVPAAPKIKRVVRYWDKAGTDKSKNPNSAETAGVLLAETKDYKDFDYIVLDIVSGQWNASRRNQIIYDQAHEDGKNVEIFVEQEPGSGGKESAEISVRELAGFKVEPDRVTGSKTTRGEPAAAQVNIGNIAMLKGEWNAAFKAQLRRFPVGKRKDMADAFNGAFNKLVLTRKRSAGTW